MINNACFTVDISGARLDVTLSRMFPSSSRALCRDAIDAGLVSVNGRSALKGIKLFAGDHVTVSSLMERSDNRVKADDAVPLHVVFEDDALLGLDKPAGVPVQPLTWRERGTLMNSVVAHYPETVDVGDQPLMAGALHRIDTGTSGLVMVARTAEAFNGLRAQFDAQSVEKIYLALVEGHIAVGGTLIHTLAHAPDVTRCRMINADTVAHPDCRLHAETRYTPIGFASGAEPRTLVRVIIRTGVTHQIRCQLALAGFPIVNDTLYGARGVAGWTGHALHAFEIHFSHPLRHAPTVIQTPLPAWARCGF